MSTGKHDITDDPMFSEIDPKKMAEAERMVTDRIERLTYLETKIRDGTATREEEGEYDDMTWWMNHPVPALPAPEGTPNPWELPRPPKKPKPEDADQ